MSDKKPRSLLRWLITYTLVVMVLQVWAIIGYVFQPAVEADMATTFTITVFHSPIILKGIGFFIFAQLLLYSIFVGFIFAITKLLSKLFKYSSKQYMRLGSMLFLFGLITLIFANQFLFPYSLFSFFPHSGYINSMVGWCLLVYGFIWLGLSVLAFISLIKIVSKNKKYLTGLVVFVGALILSFAYQKLSFSKHTHKKANKPNIIIIGIDALRPDYLTHNGATQEIMPNVDKFLNGSTNFSNATTPLGRTFAAWMSILTGDYPIKTHARYSLPDYRDVEKKSDLPNLLRKKSYYTVFGIDERRFNNIDEHFGFDKVIGPKLGFNDFFIGTVNDTPLSNLVKNTKLGKWLFPYNYANHADYKTYNLDTFINYVNDDLQVPDGKPLFLALHFCLPHWPWLWSNAPYVDMLPGNPRDMALYYNSLTAADDQFGKLMAVLKNKGLLDNAIVVLLSDHGQSFQIPKEQLLWPGMYKGPKKEFTKELGHVISPMVGHGTSVLNFTQYHPLLAFKYFGSKQKNPGEIKQTVSLVDIAPTLAEFAKVPMSNAQGQSLYPFLTGDKKHYPSPKPVYMETGFTVPGVLVSQKSLAKILRQSFSYFKIQADSGKLIIRPSLGKLIIKGKQRAILENNWLLAYTPLPNGLQTQVTIVNMRSHEWTDDIYSKFGKTTPGVKMLAELKKFYGKEIKV